jgi:hypothetical protein
MRLMSPTRFASLAVAATLCGLAFWQLRAGPESTPGALREAIRALFGYDLEVAARLIIAAEFGGAAAVLLVGNGFLSMTASIAGLFVALACLSRSLSVGGMLAPIGAMALFGALLFMSYKAAKTARALREAEESPRRGLSPAWSLLGAIAAMTTSAHFAASAQFKSAEGASAPAPAPSQTVPSIDLDMRAFVGQPLSQSPLGKYMPELESLCSTANAPDGAYVVVYSPSCGTCYSLFRDNFSMPRPQRVIAIAIPLADGAVSAATEPPAPIECFDCVERTLPQGPRWLVASPMVLRIEGGIVTCAADRLGGDCLPR